MPANRSENSRIWRNESDEEIWQAIVTERGQDDAADSQISTFDLKSEEWELFKILQRLYPVNFFGWGVPIPPGYDRVISQVVLMKKLREVSALIGFTRIISPGDTPISMKYRT